MTERQQQLLTFLIESYIDTAEPVGSKFVVDEGTFDVSGATVRNELRELEEMGYLTHPHTSAGRVPTESGYQLYVRELMPRPKLKASEQAFVERITETDSDMRLKQIAKETADIVSAAVIISFDSTRIYYTGMSALFSQPEFQNYAETVKMGELFDHIEDRIPSIMEQLTSVSTAFIGSEHPFGSATSIVARRIGERGAFIYIAPIRMQYSKALACLDTLDTLIS
jgi:transcriptional regulator of heat shock response